MNEGILLVAFLSVSAYIQAPLAHRLPTLTAGACETSGDFLEPLPTTRLSAPGYRARLEFAQGVENVLHQRDIPEAMPNQLEVALLDRRWEFEKIQRSLTTETELSGRGEDVLRQLAEEAQKIIDESFRVGKGKALTPLIAFTTDHHGELGWALLYIVLADRPALGPSPAFSAELTTDGRLFVRILGRDLDRAHLGKAVASGLVNLGIKCGPLLEHNLPHSQK